MDFQVDGPGFHPWLPPELDAPVCRDLCYRQAVLNIAIAGHGDRVARFAVDGQACPKLWLPAGCQGAVKLEITLA